jgi:hypothetical protein
MSSEKRRASNPNPDPSLQLVKRPNLGSSSAVTRAHASSSSGALVQAVCSILTSRLDHLLNSWRGLMYYYRHRERAPCRLSSWSSQGILGRYSPQSLTRLGTLSLQAPWIEVLVCDSPAGAASAITNTHSVVEDIRRLRKLWRPNRPPWCSPRSTVVTRFRNIVLGLGRYAPCQLGSDFGPTNTSIRRARGDRQHHGY